MFLTDPYKGYSNKIDSKNRFHTYSIMQKELAYASLNDENAFSLTTDALTFNSTNEHPWLWLKNNDSNLYLFFSSIIYTYNKGDTNHDRSMIKKVYINPPKPTDRFEECPPLNLNFGSLNTASIESYCWNESGDGMEVDLSNSHNFSTCIIPGQEILTDIEGVVLPFGTSILFTYEPEEIGKGAISTKVFYNNA